MYPQVLSETFWVWNVRKILKLTYVMANSASKYLALRYMVPFKRKDKLYIYHILLVKNKKSGKNN